MGATRITLERPLTAREAKALAGEEKWLKAVIAVDAFDLLGLGMDGLNSLTDERIFGGEGVGLEDIRYHVVGHDGDTLHIEVEGDATSHLAELFCRNPACDNELDGEGWDGLCGSCADQVEAGELHLDD